MKKFDTFVCYDGLVVVASSSLPEAEVGTHYKKNHKILRILKAENIISANIIFRKMVKTKSNQHKILDNFYLEHFRIEDIISYIIGK